MVNNDENDINIYRSGRQGIRCQWNRISSRCRKSDRNMTTADSVIEEIVETIARSASEIHHGLSQRRGHIDAENPSGETQAEADIFADELLAERLTAIDGVSQYASEEQSEVIDCDGEGVSVTVDPIDGTSNLRSNNLVGTVFGIYDEPLPALGTALVGAGYVIYGPVTTMTYACNGTVSKYALTEGKRTLIHDNYTIPNDPVVYGFGGLKSTWPDNFRKFAREIEKELNLHYCGAMIADVDAVLTNGGIFAYPSLRDSPDGKLRLQFEGNPIGYIVESAGGRSSDGTRSMLEVEPNGLHDRVPFHVGTTGLIERLESAL